MKYIFNRSVKIVQGDDVIIHYTTGNNGFEIIGYCPSCLEKYLEKTKGDTYRKEDDIERKSANELVVFIPEVF